MSKKDKKPKIPKGKELEYIKQHKKTNYSNHQSQLVSLQDEDIKISVTTKKIQCYTEHVYKSLNKSGWTKNDNCINILHYIKQHNLTGYPFTTIKLFLKGVCEYIKHGSFIGEIPKDQEELLKVQSLLNKALSSIPKNIMVKLNNDLEKHRTFKKILMNETTKFYCNTYFKIIRWFLSYYYHFSILTCQDLGKYDFTYYNKAIIYLKKVLTFGDIPQGLVDKLLAENYNLLAQYYKKESFKENNATQSENKNLLAYIQNHKNAKLHYREYVNEVTESFKTKSIFQENTKKIYYKYRAVNEYTLQSLSKPHLYFAKPQELNDPTDIFIEYSSFVFCHQEFTPRIFSMSINHNNSVMWGHYADGHKGFVIAYCFQEDKEFLKQINNLTAVTYQEKKEDNINSTEDMLRVDTERKHIHWRYEEEYRFLRFCANGVLQHNPNCIKAIYFGLKCSKENKKIIYQILSHHKVKEPIKYFKIILPNSFSNLYELKTQEIFWDSKTEEFKIKIP